MRYGSLGIGCAAKLTPEQLHIAIGLSAERLYKNRLSARAHSDWDEAYRRVRTEKNKHPTDDEIRPVADAVYQERVKRVILADFDDAIRRLKNNGNPHPTEEQILATMELVRKERQKKEEIDDWLQAEKDVNMSGSVLVPWEWVESRK